MRLISAHDGKLLTLNADSCAPAGNGHSFSSGIGEWDAIAPGGGFARGAIHELLTDPRDGRAMFLAMMLAIASIRQTPKTTPQRDERTSRLNTTSLDAAPIRPFAPPSLESAAFSSKFLVWCDDARTLYPPALSAQGLPLDRLLLLHPKQPDRNGEELVWMMNECLRCKGVGAVVGAAPRLSRLMARRLQLAAENGRSAGLLLRHIGRDSLHHAAASRWLISPTPGERRIQRWTIQLLHGHGGRVGETVCLEHCRTSNSLRRFDLKPNIETASIAI